MSRTYDTLNDVLVRLFHDIMTLEEKAIRTGEFCEISNNDMHIIEAILSCIRSTLDFMDAA